MPEGTERSRLLAAWSAEERDQPEGWDFSALSGRMHEDDEPWDLAAHWRAALTGADRVLDLGTGGGEFLGGFADVLPERTVAVEGWRPNIGAAGRRLSAYGVSVLGSDSDPASRGDALPFADGSFDLVLDRHEGYRPEEVARVLARGGTFLTQQVGGDEFTDVRAAFGLSAFLPQVTFDQCRADLHGAGLQVLDGAETVGHYAFEDVAALVAYVQLVPWNVPEDFTVERYADVLLRLHAAGPAAGRPVRARRKRFWLKARKPAH